MAEVLLSPFLKLVMQKAADRLLQRFGVMWGIEGKREKLESMLSAIQDKLGDAEERQVEEEGVKRWLAALKDAAYEADDILDEFNLEVMRREIEIQVDMKKKVRSFFTFHNPVWFRFKMGRRLNDIVNKIKEIIDQGNNFGFVVQTPPQSGDRPQTHSYVDESDVIGREEDKEKMVKLLLDHDRNQNVAVLPIVGMGGLGKTTLAKMIFQDGRVQKHFQPLIWVCVSDDLDFANHIKKKKEYDVAKVARKIITSATGDECSLSTMELLQRDLRKVVSGKRYLLVLDDVWNEDQAKWDELKSLLGTGGEGSRIIVTARNEQVSSIMGTLDAYLLQGLTEDDSWALFRKKAFKEGAEVPPTLEKIGKDIVRKCEGLPLAVRALGGLMHSKSQETEWSSVRDSEIWEMQVGEDGILPALRLSYRYLPSHLKQCFAFCAIFPKDYEMEKDLLIQLWMANGFIPSGGRKELEDKGEEIFNELASRSFFQDIKELEERISNEFMTEVKEYTVRRSRHELYYITTCKLHDLMHDLAQSIMGNECLSTLDPATLENISRKTRHLGSFLYFFQSNVDHNISLKNYPNIRTLVCQATVTADSSKPRSLRALGLPRTSISRLPISIGFLKHLRYLDLSHAHIEALPDATSTLLNLQTLKLSNCWRLRKLPEDLRNMSGLRHLYIDRCNSLDHLPAGIGQLSSLRTLTKYIVGNDPGRHIVELNNLNLGGLLELYNLRNVRDAADAKEANLSSKHNLRSLILCWDMIAWNDACYAENVPYDCEDVLHVENAEEVLEALGPHKGLKLLAIWRYGGGGFPTWMMDSLLLQNLVEIHLGACIGCEHLPPLWQLPELKFLYLIKMDRIEHICSSSIYGNANNGTVRAFPKLERLVLHTMQSLVEWSKDEGTAEVTLEIPQLARLSIIDCPNLMTMPKLPSLRSFKMVGPDKQLGLVCSLTTVSSLYINHYKTSNGTESSPRARKELSFRFLKFLENLFIFGASVDLARLLELEEEKRWLSTSLHHLQIEQSNWLCSSSALGFWKNLTSLQSLKMGDCDDLVYWPEEEFRGLNSLKKLNIWRCNKLVGPSSSSSSGYGELLPNLVELDIRSCDGLLELPMLPASLRSLRLGICPKMTMMEGLRHATALDNLSIYDCSSLTSVPLQLAHLTALTSISLWVLPGLTCLPQGFGQLTALKSLDIRDCSNLSSLPEGMQGLTALQRLSFRRCPQLSSLPEGLQQRLSSLQMLDIKECPNLERQYARGGPYWDLIAHIPDTGTLSERRSNFSTFLPSFSCF